MPVRTRRAKMGMLMLEVKILKDQWGQSSALLYTRKLEMTCKVSTNVEDICFTYSSPVLNSFFLFFESRNLYLLIL